MQATTSHDTIERLSRLAELGDEEARGALQRARMRANEEKRPAIERARLLAAAGASFSLGKLPYFAKGVFGGRLVKHLCEQLCELDPNVDKTPRWNQWVHFLSIDTDGYLQLDYHSAGSIPGDLYHGTAQELWSSSAQVARVDDVIGVLCDELASLVVLVDGFDLAWNGSNEIGQFTRPAEEAYDRICERLAAERLEIPTYWDAADYLVDDLSREDVFRFLADETTCLDDMIEDAGTDGVYLDRDDLAEAIGTKIEGMRYDLSAAIDEALDDYDEEEAERFECLDEDEILEHWANETIEDLPAEQAEFVRRVLEAAPLPF